ncbi:MAG: pimeloyl-ACP methyl ester carboxylesterase [Gammaproteobacteria bacterium]|jgi:pimeloyl-ACP methyl ester carboxylesterase
MDTVVLDNEVVLLLHGLGRSVRSMHRMERALIQHGYRVQNIAYQSRKKPIEQLAVDAIGTALQNQQGAAKIHFVTHSLGGILVRQYLAHHQIANLGRVVMLGPPNQGTEIVDKLGQFPGFRWMNGDAGIQLGTLASSLPNQLGGADFDVGIIAGTRSVNLILSALIPGRNDGKVAVEKTKLPGMRDHLEMAVTHPFMMRNKRVIEQVICYLQSGGFHRRPSRQALSR